MAFRRPPRPIPALEVFPTLKRFAKQKYHPFQPRNDRIPPGTQHPYSRGLRVQSMSHLYHDLGVMVFAGTTDRQTRKIGDILKESMAHPGGLPSLLGYKYDDGSRYTVYNVGRKAMKSINGERGLGQRELHRLAESVGKRFCSEAMVKFQDPEKLYPDLKFQQYDVKEWKQTRQMVTHPTVDGPRRLSIYACVFPIAAPDHLELNIKCYSVGTSSFLGSVKLPVEVKFRSKETGEHVAMKNGMLDLFLDQLPIWDVCKRQRLDSIMSQTLALEDEVWAKQWEGYEEAQGTGTRLRVLKGAHKEIFNEVVALRQELREMQASRRENDGEKGEWDVKSPQFKKRARGRAWIEAVDDDSRRGE